MEKLLIHLDGASQGNPGEAAVGVVITDGDGSLLEEVSECIGRATNNVAEYQALLEAIRRALRYAPQRAIFFTDSQLLANQINGLYRIRRPHLEPLHRQAQELLQKLPRWQVHYIERDANWRAHRLAQKALLDRVAKEAEAGLPERIRRKVEELNELDQRRVLEFVNRLYEEAQKEKI
ncbi:ribonuclease HI family protein [Candidatus Acetothermia bacterium]|jgi:ribonuclease HI|nr:ribonuclease HI family protein [Candidatus Acetothermia bacterium]MCI2431059.1 ribonuclease HI family protein [Candidatus Acetothermia bacterium]MCI2435683.1 ribonuclease HI family protein [Candidatus Acetothermia bacterium]